ncbi:fungal-specific transcription factor domain-containing protein [Aspergillus ambiguus]|uniref:transcription factor domain-containing protein n=1 Tax=Aspergillus ambiguus TaxID=176160 RepID=UPI003CCDCE8D
MPRQKDRATAACLLCRQKKLKCDTQKPQCGNCKIKGIECQQGALRHKPRPTNHRIAQLEHENELLRQKCSQLGSTDSVLDEDQQPRRADWLASTSPVQPQGLGSATNDSLGSPRDAHVGLSRDTLAPEVPDSQKNASLYHGPTSTIYDDTATWDESESTSRRLTTLNNDEWTKCVLFSETARQRQLEPLNVVAGRFDFDGVDPDTAMELLSIYWSRQLYTAQIIYRPVFMRDMACGGPYFSKLLLNAIFFAVSKHCTRPGIRSNPEDITTAGYRYRQRFSELLRDCFDKSEITTLQALLIMSNALFSRCDERSLSWLYAGNAFNMIIDLGLHVLPSPGTLPAEEYELRRRILWGAYLIDKIQCLFQGRPPLLRRINFDAPLKFLDEYDELDLFQGTTYGMAQHLTGAPSLNVTLLTKLCELSLIAERILCDVYSESQVMSRTHSSNVLEDIKSSLSSWRNSLPPQLDYTSASLPVVVLPQTYCLLALYNVLIILSQRPSINDSHRNGGVSTSVHESVNACTAAANQIAQILRDYSQGFSIHSAPYLLSYAAYISATIHARVVAQKGQASSAFQFLILCRNALKANERLYSAAGKAGANLDKLACRLGINLAEDSVVMGGNAVAVSDVEIPNCLSNAPGNPNQCDETSFLASNWELSDLDLEAIAHGFQIDGDFNYLMHPLGS